MLPRRTVFGVLAILLGGTGMCHLATAPSEPFLFQAQTVAPAYVVASPDGTALASVSLRDHAVVLWDTARRTRTATLRGFSGFGRPIAFSPDSRLLATGGAAGVVQLWDVGTGEERAAMPGHADAVTSLAFSPDGTMIVSGSYDKTVRLWDAIRHKEVGILRGHATKVYCVAFSPGGGTTLASGDESTIKLWDIPSREETATLTEGRNSISSVVFSPDGRLLASAEFIEGGKLWDLRSRKELPLETPPWLDEYDDAVQHLAFSADSALLAVATDLTAGVWNVATGKMTSLFGRGHKGGWLKRLASFEPARPNAETYYLSSLRWKATNEIVTLGRREESVVAWSVEVPR